MCGQESNGLWLLNLAKIDNLSVIKGKNIRRSVCEDCVERLNQVVDELGNGTSMERAFSKAGVAPKNPMPNQSINRHRNNKIMIKDDIQNEFFESLIKEKKLVQVEAVEGIGWRGYLQKFDNFSLILIVEQTETIELIFKHAIKSIKPL